MIVNKKNNATKLLTLSSVFLYFFTAYFLDRTDFYTLLGLWTGLFFCFYVLIQKQQHNFAYLAGISILFKLIFLFSIPNLSQDFYRFIWDGRMILEGFNPYVSLPQTFIEQLNFPVAQAIDLYTGMGEFNGSHYTNYPPINQFCFLIAALLANKSILGAVVVMRIIILLAEIGILYFGKKLLEQLHIPIHHIFWYALNPLVIIELTGNLHFEPVMLFFLVWSLYKIKQQKWVLGALLLACAISIKLIPLLFLPLFYQWFVTPIDKNTIPGQTHSKASGFLKLFAFYGIVVLTTALLFLPFYSATFVSNYSSSIGLWFKNFEFNASFYYLFRAIGYQFRGWNEIAIIGKIMPILTILFLGILTFYRKNNSLKQLITALLFGLSFYYFTTTTVHPWYLATLILLAVFTKYRFPIVWSLVIVLSYATYTTESYTENLWLVGIEYVVVYGLMIFELYIKPLKIKI